MSKLPNTATIEMALYLARQPVAPTFPEPPEDIAAQMRALADPRSTKRAVFIAAGSPVPHSLPLGVKAATRPEGTLLSRDEKLLKEFREARHVTQRWMARALGYPQDKAEVLGRILHHGDAPVAVRAHDGGGIAYETVAAPDAIGRAIAAAHRQVPGCQVAVTTPEAVIRDRAKRGVAAGYRCPALSGAIPNANVDAVVDSPRLSG